MISRILDWLFGYDFFVSYAHDDSPEYAKKIRDELTELGYSVFLDSDVYVAGTVLTDATRRRVRMSRHLILVAGRHALHSSWVSEEVRIHLHKGNAPLVIDPIGAVSTAIGSDTADQILGNHWRRIEEPNRLSTGKPSRSTIEELSRSFTSTRQESKRRRALGASIGGILLIIGVAVYVWNEANNRQLEASIRTANALTARAEEARDRRNYKDAGILALAASVARKDGVISKETAEVFRDVALVNLASAYKLGKPWEDAVRALAFKPGSAEVAIATNRGDIQFFDPVSWSMTKRLNVDGSLYVADLEFLNSGSKLLVVTVDSDKFHSTEGSRALLFDLSLESTKPKTLVDLSERSFLNLAVAPDQSWGIIGATDNRVYWLNLNARGSPQIYRPKSHNYHTNKWRNNVYDVAISATGKYAAVATGSNKVEILAKFATEPLVVLNDFENRDFGSGNRDRVNALSFASDDIVLTGSFDGDIEQWESTTAKRVKPTLKSLPSLSVNYKSVDALAISPSRELILSGASNGDVLLRQINSGQVVARLFGSSHPVTAVAYSIDGKWVASGGEDSVVWVWPIDQIRSPDLISILCDRLEKNGTLTDEKIAQVEARYGQSLPKVCTLDHMSMRIGRDQLR